MEGSSGFRPIYDRHAAMVFNLCLNYLHSTHDAEEVTQDVFVKVHERLGQFRGEAEVSTWIYRITVNACLDRLRARKRRSRFGLHLFFGSDIREDAREFPQFNHPGVPMEDREATERIMKAIGTLPERQQTALILKTIDGLSQQQIANVMGLTVKAVESLLSRARATLNEKLRGSEG